MTNAFKKSALILVLTLALIPQTRAATSTEDLPTEKSLEIVNVGILPTSPLYFLKEWRRNLRRALTSDPVAKLALEIRIVNDKAFEIKKVEELNGDAKGIKKAVKNYEANQARLEARLAVLEGTSENPNIDYLLDLLANRIIRHERLLNDAAARFSEDAEVRQSVTAAKRAMSRVVAGAVEKDSPVDFAAKLDKALRTVAAGDEAEDQEFLDGLDLPLRIQRAEPAIRPLQPIIEKIRERTEPKLTKPETKIDHATSSEPIVCTEEYAPVCGEDGKTYSNACRARAASTTVTTSGECGALKLATSTDTLSQNSSGPRATSTFLEELQASVATATSVTVPTSTTTSTSRVENASSSGQNNQP